MSRRGENIRKRKDGRWEARYPSGVNEKGRKTYTSVYGRTYGEVKEKRKLAMDQNSHPASPKGVYSFKEVLWLWLECNQLRLKDATKYRYRYLIETHILPELGHMKVNQITETVINRYVTQKAACGRLDGTSGLSPSYLHSIMLIVSAALRFAAERKMCTPVHIQVSKPAIRPKELPILSRELQIKLEKYLLLDADGTKLGIYITLYTGMRIGEICALSWDDIDLENRLIHVRHTIARISSGTEGNSATLLVIDQPKTKASLRCIPICSNLQALLSAHGEPVGSEYVVSGSPQFMSPRTYEYRYKKILNAAGIPNVNYHALRHTFATRCIESGMDPKSLSEILGHASVSVTLNTYVHPSMELKREQLKKIAVT